jgi:hypothetical protein
MQGDATPHWALVHIEPHCRSWGFGGGSYETLLGLLSALEDDEAPFHIDADHWLYPGAISIGPPRLCDLEEPMDESPAAATSILAQPGDSLPRVEELEQDLPFDLSVARPSSQSASLWLAFGLVHKWAFEYEFANPLTDAGPLVIGDLEGSADLPPESADV